MTASLRCDVAVIGAGPGGSRTAERLARSGLKVVLLEKRERIGYPVRCAEAVGPRSDVERFLELDDELVSCPVNGVVIVAPDGTRIEREIPGVGFVLDRESFDKRLAEIAENSGANLRTGHQAMELLRRDGRIAGARVKDLSNGSYYDIFAQLVVGADGIESLSPRWAGLKHAFKPAEIFACAQELITGIDVEKSFIEFYLSRTFAPGGYAWVFPKGPDRANVGVGVNPTMAGGKSATSYLETFLKYRCPQGKKNRLVVGGCSVARGLEHLETDGFVAVGEAANQNNPFSGGGIINALEGADMAAEAIEKALKKGSVSAKDLSSYSRAWKNSTGKTNELFYRAARVFFSLSDDELTRTIKELSKVKGIFDERGIKPAKMLQALVVSNPKLLIKFFATKPEKR